MPDVRLNNRVKDCVDLEMRFNGESFLGSNEYNRSGSERN